MQLLKPYINNIGSHKSKPTARQLQAKAEHDAWLKKNGVHPDQLKNKPKSKIALPKFKRDDTQLSNTIVDGGRDRSIMGNLYKESDATKRGVLNNVAKTTQLYNKGGYGVAVPSDGNVLGSRSRRL